MAAQAFPGTWEVINCEIVKGTHGSNYEKYFKCMEGVRVKLEENGDVTWTAPDELKSVPLFTCETFEVYKSTSRSSLVLRFGAYNGHVFEFIPENWSKDSITLTSEELCTFHCVRVKDDKPEVPYILPFTLLPALEDGYFSDITITSSNKKEFQVHSTILELLGNDLDWMSNPPPFSNLPEDVLGTILHYLYAECLPENLKEETVRQVITYTAPYASLVKLVNNCQLYLNNMALKQQIISLLSDMYSFINQIIERFNTKGSSSNSSGESIGDNPSKLCFIVKQSVRDTAVVIVKLLLLCDLFTKGKNELSRSERHDIIRYAKPRLSVFLNQLTRLLQCLKNTFSSISPGQRLEVSTFLVPEIEAILDTISTLVAHVEKALQQLIQGLFMPESKNCKSNMAEMLSRMWRNILHVRELTKLNTLHEHLTFSLTVLLHKKENFNQMTFAQKVRSISTNIEQLIEELPILLIRLEEFATVFDENLEWRDFKFCFKVGTSRVSDILSKLKGNTKYLQDVMQQLCELVQRDAFTETLHCLGLLEETITTTTSETTRGSCDTSKTTKTTSNSSATPNHHGYKLNLVKALCTPLDSNKSQLSQLCLHLFKDGARKSDLEFEVLGNTTQEYSEDNSTTTVTSNSDSNNCGLPTAIEEKCIIKSHRVIVAARCDWFRRALQSGMREAIDKKIIIHDTSPFVFKILLEYLYTGRLDHSSMRIDQLVDLLLLSDRYEMDTLKHTCEHALLKSIDSESVLYFISMADQYNARLLRGQCLKFISQHHELTESEDFFELPISLQAEIFDCIWTQPSGGVGKQSDSDFGIPTPSGSINSLNEYCGTNRIMSIAESMLLTPELEDPSLDDLQRDHNSVRMNECIMHLRDIVGETAPRDELVQVILAADFDLRRAVNYYYARNNEAE